MITYKLSKREKALLLLLALVLVAIAWFVLVFQNTTSQVARLESEISTTESSIQFDRNRVSQMEAMQATIDERKAEGAKMAQVPEYDNLQAVMAELNRIMEAVPTYTLSFDDLDRESGDEYVRRGVGISFNADSYASAEAVIKALANGAYPCVVDSAAITDSSARSSSSRTNAAQGSAAVSAYVHVTFFEKYPSDSASASADSSAS